MTRADLSYKLTPSPAVGPTVEFPARGKEEVQETEALARPEFPAQRGLKVRTTPNSEEEVLEQNRSCETGCGGTHLDPAS